MLESRAAPLRDLAVHEQVIGTRGVLEALEKVTPLSKSAGEVPGTDTNDMVALGLDIKTPNVPVEQLPLKKRYGYLKSKSEEPSSTSEHGLHISAPTSSPKHTEHTLEVLDTRLQALKGRLKVLEISDSARAAPLKANRVLTRSMSARTLGERQSPASSLVVVPHPKKLRSNSFKRARVDSLTRESVYTPTHSPSPSWQPHDIGHGATEIEYPLFKPPRSGHTPTHSPASSWIPDDVESPSSPEVHWSNAPSKLS